MYSRTRRYVVGVAGALLLPATLVACSGADQVIDQAQSIAGISQDLVEVCSTAAPAWATDIPAADARAALTDASAKAAALIDAGDTGPALVAVDQALAAAVEALALDPTDVALTTTVAAVQAACAVVDTVN